MRLRLLATLMASLALHILIAGGIVLSFVHGGKTHSSHPVPAGVTHLILMRSSDLALLKSNVPGFVSKPLTSSVTPALPTPPSVPAPGGVEKALIAQKTVAEANPNAHLPTPAPEAILDPMPPPVLNAASGVVLVLDVSGSMYESYAGSTRLTYARQVLCERIRALKNGTPFALVLYAQRASASGPLVAATEATREAAIRFILREVDCGGGTNLPEGLAAAERLHTGDIVLLSDGDLNTTVQNLSARAREILGDGRHGPSLEVFGIAPRFTENAEQLLQTLASEQGGTYQAEETAGDTGLLSSRTKVPETP